MTDQSRKHNNIDYIEFTVSDMKESKNFYSTAFGWTFADYGPEYAGIKGDDGEVGGFALGKVTSGSTLVVLYSTNLENTLKDIQTAGGKITRETFEFPGGRRFHFEDPSGNELAVWSDK